MKKNIFAVTAALLLACTAQTALAQGIVVRYEVPDGAESDSSRNGGFGSTDR